MHRRCLLEVRSTHLRAITLSRHSGSATGNATGSCTGVQARNLSCTALVTEVWLWQPIYVRSIREPRERSMRDCTRSLRMFSESGAIGSAARLAAIRRSFTIVAVSGAAINIS